MKLDAAQLLQVSYKATYKDFHFLHLFIAPAPITEPPVDLAKRCDPANCELPYCFCSKDGTLIPGGLDAEDVKRIINLLK